MESGQTVATIEAMKMEASITAQQAGTVKRLAIGKVQQVEGGDLLLELEWPAPHRGRSRRGLRRGAARSGGAGTMPP